jgi:hypothetical protein
MAHEFHELARMIFGLSKMKRILMSLLAVFENQNFEYVYHVELFVWIRAIRG